MPDPLPYPAAGREGRGLRGQHAHRTRGDPRSRQRGAERFERRLRLEGQRGHETVAVPDLVRADGLGAGDGGVPLDDDAVAVALEADLSGMHEPARGILVRLSGCRRNTQRGKAQVRADWALRQILAQSPKRKAPSEEGAAFGRFSALPYASGCLLRFAGSRRLDTLKRIILWE